MTHVSRIDVCIVALAELFRGDGEILASPMGLAPSLGARLARRTFEPDLLLSDGVATLVDNTGAAEGWVPYQRIFDLVWHGRRHVVMGASQLDARGRQNIAAIGPHARPKTMLIGARGAPGNTICHPTSYWVPRHSTRVFVPEVDFASGAGVGDAKDLRRVVSDLGVFRFTGEGMEVLSLHPGVAWDEVVAKTGFALRRGVDLPESRLPSREELAILDQLDPKRGRDKELA